MNLPAGNGYEIIKKYASSGIKIFVLTSQDDEQLREISFQNGVIDYIVKDKDFFLKLDNISKIIEKIEKNKQSSILIVEDSYVIQEQLTEILSNRNYQTFSCDCVERIMEMIEVNDIDLMLLDVNLKDKNGIDFLNKKRNIIIDKLNIPVIIVSGSKDTDIIREGLKAGAKDVLRKPYIVEELVLKVDLNIDYKRKEKENKYFQFLLEQYKNVLEDSFNILTCDKHGFIKNVNKCLCELTGFEKNELIHKSHNIFNPSDNSEKFYLSLWNKIKNDNKIWKGKIKSQKKNGKFFWSELTIKPVINNKGHIEEYIFIFKDISKEKLLENYVKHINKINS
jgi:PAS domain S-box-containing protein